LALSLKLMRSIAVSAWTDSSREIVDKKIVPQPKIVNKAISGGQPKDQNAKAANSKCLVFLSGWDHPMTSHRYFLNQPIAESAALESHGSW